MRLRTTLLLLILAVALGVWIKYFESTKPNTAETKRQAGNVISLDREKLEGIVIQNGDERIELHRQNGKWRLTAPVQDQADATAVDNLISDLETWQKFAIIPGKGDPKVDKASLAEFGVIQPKLRLKLLMPDAPPEIRFGKEAALQSQMYVRLGEAKDVFIAGQTVRNDIAKKPDDFRDRKLTGLTTAQVTRAVLKSPAGEIELAKKNEHWELVKPLQARGDDQKIGDLLAQVTNARIEEFVGDGSGDLHTYGLAEPRGSITIYGADDKQGETLQIGDAPERKKDQVFARFLPRQGVYALPKKTGEILTVRPNDLRDRHLVRLDGDNLDRIHIQGAGQPEIVLARKGEAWTIASKNSDPANGEEVRRLLSTLNEQQVMKFVADTASDLPKYGLDHPSLQLTFGSFASENTAETAAGEHPFLTLSFGKTEGDEVYARVGEEPFIVAVNRQLLPQIWSDPSQWQELAIFKFKPNEIQHFARVTDREESFERIGPQSWKATKGDAAVDDTDVQSLINTLASLRAVRWAGATTSAQGFEQAQLVLTFAASPDPKTLHKLTIGGRTDNTMWFAKVDSRDGTFVISNPDFTAFKLPLTKAAARAAPSLPAASSMPSPAVSSSPAPAPPTGG
ncbi:MAG: DUF4340 domain-containing protein [Chthoniobacterales bacterium]|nr:DUF4340 domain-containing protein [Chthoniobacterales bacterium]